MSRHFLAVLFLAWVARSAADEPAILSISTADPDDNDRIYSDGDTITLLFTVTTGGGSFLASTRQIDGVMDETHTVGIALADKAAVDAVVSFDVNLGAAYSGQWSNLFGPMYQLQITVSDVTGADFAQLESHNFTVTCVPNAIQLRLATVDDAPCSNSMTPTPTADWGRGRPAIANVTSHSANMSLLLGPGDKVHVHFDLPVDLDAVATHAATNLLNGSAYVRARARARRHAASRRVRGTRPTVAPVFCDAAALVRASAPSRVVRAGRRALRHADRRAGQRVQR